MDRPGLGHDTAEPACDTAGEGLQYGRDMGRDTAGRAQGRAAARARGLASRGSRYKNCIVAERGATLGRDIARQAQQRHDTALRHNDQCAPTRHD